ncbi:hypothetical protein MUCCIDRAFT_107896 [Mucor lusitanicus CBS 277.49]|uniref:Uncharacterized protein n=1 Tax=Mucor lusitanicus CBS 277.49 TaxID=747725 RepID=A0A162TUP3_MUCCL|nr:hypothetical protein MUCCIDRAFT_107896 [Mucor lusitanicus CBS 277.49]
MKNWKMKKKKYGENAELLCGQIHDVLHISIFEAVFQSDALLSYQWANGYLQGNDNGAESDQVKTGKEMQWMTNALVRRGVNDSVVCAVMLKGYTILQGAVALPAILRNILHIVKKTAVWAKISATAKSMGTELNYSPPPSSNYHLRRLSFSNKKKN